MNKYLALAVFFSGCLLCSCQNSELIYGAWQDCYQGQVIRISNGGTTALFSPPGEPDSYYRGSRFDHSGNFLTLQRRGHVYVSEWYDGYDPLRHDCLMGPVDSFDPIGAAEAAPGENYLTIGIGLIEKSEGNRLNVMKYNEISDCGQWEVVSDKTSVRFIQTLLSEKYSYVYEKNISLDEKGVMTISHSVLNNGTDSLIANVYNHNFFVFDGARTGIATHIDFPFHPSGEWMTGRNVSKDVSFTDSGIRFSSDLQEKQSVQVYKILTSEGSVPQYEFSVSNADNGLGVSVKGSDPINRMQFWSNQRVSCIEPFNHLSVAPGQTQEWSIVYTLK